MKKERALAVCTTALGDTLLCTPALSVLGRKFDLDVLVHQKRLPLLQGNPHIKQLFSYRNNDLVRLFLGVKLCFRKYSRVVVLHANSDVRKLLSFLRYDQAWNLQGWENKAKRLYAMVPDPSQHVIEKRLNLTDLVGADSDPEPMRVYLSEEELYAGRAWLADRGLQDKKLVALCPGAAQIYKTWPASNFGWVAGRLAEKQAACLVVGSAGESGLAEEVQNASGKEVVNALGLPLRLCAAVLAQVEFLITNDTGPMHLCQAVGRPVLALFGPTDAKTIGPILPGSRILETPRTCEKCLTKACQDPVCMRALDKEKVLSVASVMLDSLKGKES